MLDHDKERGRLEHIANDSWYGQSLNVRMVLYTYKAISRFFHGTSCLEMGPAEGFMSRLLDKRFPDLTLVEGAPHFAQALRERYPQRAVFQALFEEYEPNRQFDTIVMGHVLEHVANPVEILARVKTWLTKDGVLLATVPNARSLHRQAAVIMGLLPEEHALNEADIHHGHRRVYDPESFRNDFRRAGMCINFFGGYWLKPISNSQLEKSWTPEMIEAFMALGERYPDIAAELLMVASNP